MRVLEKDKQTFDLEKLGLMGSQHEIFMEHILSTINNPLN